MMELSTTFSVKSAMPTNIPYCTEPEIKPTVVLLIDETHSVKRIAAKAKHRVERTHIVILNPALSLGALKSTKMKFKTPKTTAR